MWFMTTKDRHALISSNSHLRYTLWLRSIRLLPSTKTTLFFPQYRYQCTVPLSGVNFPMEVFSFTHALSYIVCKVDIHWVGEGGMVSGGRVCRNGRGWGRAGRGWIYCSFSLSFPWSLLLGKCCCCFQVPAGPLPRTRRVVLEKGVKRMASGRQQLNETIGWMRREPQSMLMYV